MGFSLLNKPFGEFSALAKQASHYLKPAATQMAIGAAAGGAAGYADDGFSGALMGAGLGAAAGGAYGKGMHSAFRIGANRGGVAGGFSAVKSMAKRGWAHSGRAL